MKRQPLHGRRRRVPPPMGSIRRTAPAGLARRSGARNAGAGELSASSEALQSACPQPRTWAAWPLMLTCSAGSRSSAVDPSGHGARGRDQRELLTSGGGGLTSSQVSRALGITRQAVDKRRTRHALLAVPNGSGRVRISGLPVHFGRRDFRPGGSAAGLSAQESLGHNSLCCWHRRPPSGGRRSSPH